MPDMPKCPMCQMEKLCLHQTSEFNWQLTCLYCKASLNLPAEKDAWHWIGECLSGHRISAELLERLKEVTDKCFKYMEHKSWCGEGDCTCDLHETFVEVHELLAAIEAEGG